MCAGQTRTRSPALGASGFAASASGEKVTCSSEQNSTRAPSIVGLPWSIARDLSPQSATAHAPTRRSPSPPARAPAGTGDPRRCRLRPSARRSRPGSRWPSVQVVGAGAAGRDHVAADVRVGAQQKLPWTAPPARRACPLRARPSRGPRSPSRRAPRAPRDARCRPGGRPARAGSRSAAGRRSRRPAPRAPRPAPRPRSSRGSRPRRSPRASSAPEPARVEHLVGEQQVGAEPRRRHALHLADRGAAEAGGRAPPAAARARCTCAP